MITRGSMDDPERTSETLFSMAADAFSRLPIYGIFDGDVMVYWTSGRNQARRAAEDYGLTWQLIGRTRGTVTP